MREKKKFAELEFRDAFMFTAVMLEPELCRGVLERILGFPIRNVQVHTEDVIAINPEYRGVRLDVRADDDEGTRYDIEMQTVQEYDLPKRSRFYQGQMDVSSLPPGTDVRKLPKNFVIFICTFDPFGRGRYRYTYESTCVEDGVPLGDEAWRIFLSTKGQNEDEVPKSLVDFLHYVDSAEIPGTDDELLQHLKTRIAKLKNSRRLEDRYMLFEEYLREERTEGWREGQAEGQARMLRLIAAMSENGEAGEIPRLSREPELVEEKLKKYQI